MKKQPPYTWHAYNVACQNLIKCFLETYFADTSPDEIWVAGAGVTFEKTNPVDHDFTQVFFVDGYAFDIQFIQTCLKYKATLKDFLSFQEYEDQCRTSKKTPEINLANWIRYPNLRPKKKAT